MKNKKNFSRCNGGGNDFERYSLNHHLCGAE